MWFPGKERKMKMDSKMNTIQERASVLLVSVDALKPEFVFEQERLGVSLPNITS